MQTRSYHKEMEQILSELQKQPHAPTLLLHSCCAPCSSAVLEKLSPYFSIIDFFYNPNIAPEDEYRQRAAELQQLVEHMPFPNPVRFVEGRYDPARFYETVQGAEDEPEGGERCTRCFTLRLEEAAAQAVRWNCAFFTTTLTISPLKDAARINAIGERIAAENGVRYLPSDFKKQDGYKRSLELSREYDLYRQSYCGCVFSKREREG